MSEEIHEFNLKVKNKEEMGRVIISEVEEAISISLRDKVETLRIFEILGHELKVEISCKEKSNNAN